MAELAGKFAGIVVVSVPDDREDALTQALELDYELAALRIVDMTSDRMRDWLRESKFPKFLRKTTDEWADKTDDALDTVETIDKMVDAVVSISPGAGLIVAIIFSLLFVILLVRPYGLFGKETAGAMRAER